MTEVDQYNKMQFNKMQFDMSSLCKDKYLSPCPVEAGCCCLGTL